MLAPLRDYLRSGDPKSSLLLRTTKDCYFTRMSVNVDPEQPGFKDAQWIASEDVNVEHLFDVFTSVDPDSNNIWDACISFMRHLYWYKPRQVVLRPKIEALPDNHRSKPECLLNLAMLFGLVGNPTESIRLLNHALKLERERWNDDRVALTLWTLSGASQMLGLRKEGIRQAKEALEFYERLGETVQRARCLDQLARLLYDDGQLDAAEEAAVHSIKLLPEEGQEYKVCQSHRTLGNIYGTKGQREKAIHHYEVALGIASAFNWRIPLFWTHFSLAHLFLAEDEPEDAGAHAERAKFHALDNLYYLGRVAHLQARILFHQRRLEDAASEVYRALEIFEKLGALQNLETCRVLLQTIERAARSGVPSAYQVPEVSFWEKVLCSAPLNPLFSVCGASS